MSTRFHLALSACGAASAMLAVLVGPAALGGDYLSNLILVGCTVAVAVIVAAEITAPRVLVVLPDTICVHSLAGKRCVRPRDVEDVRVERLPLWRGGDRIVVETEWERLELPLGEATLERLNALVPAT